MSGRLELPDSPVELLRLADEAMARLGSAVMAEVPEDGLVEAARLSERIRRRQVGVDAGLLVEINDRNAYRREGFVRLQTWLAQGLRLGRSEASRRYRQAQKIARLTGLTGQTLAPVLPATATAVADGDIGVPHVAVIAEAVRQLPRSLPAQVAEQAESDLAGMARTLAPAQLRRAGRRLVELLDPDGRAWDDRERARGRAVWVGAQDRRSMTKLTGELTPAVRAKLEVLLAGWAAPGMNNPADAEADRLAGSVEDLPDTDEARDRLARARTADCRSTAQRNHDAFDSLLDYVLGHGGLGRPNRIPGQLVVTASLAEIKAACGDALTATGSLVPIADLVELAAHLDPSLVVFADHSREVLYLGRSKRSATFGQRLALFARDRGCSAADCDTPFAFTEAHHLPDWAKGGATDIDKLTAADGRHNRAVGERAGQWQTTYQRNGPAQGRVVWRLVCRDGDLGQPRLNQTHHPEELATGAESVQQFGNLRGSRGTDSDPPVGPTRITTDSPTTSSAPTASSGVEARLCRRLGVAVI